MEKEKETFVQPAIPKLDGHYDHWCLLMENFLRSKQYWDLIENGIPSARANQTEGQRKAIEDAKLKDLKVKNYLFQAIDRSVLETILNKDTAKSIWDSLKLKNQGTARVQRAQRQALRKDFEVLSMTSGESVNDFFARTLFVSNKLRNYGEPITDTMIIEKILRSMTPKFNYVVCSIEESTADFSAMTIDELQSRILVHEQRMNTEVIEEQVLKVTHGDSSNGRGRGRGQGSYRGRGRGRGRQSFDKSIIECYSCHKLGHFQYECPRKEQENANYTEVSDEMLLMAYQDVPTTDRREELWFLDSGCSNHMCGKKEYFSELDINYRTSVKLGDNSSMAVHGKGNIRMLVNGIVQTVIGVFYVPGLIHSLLSVGQLQEKGLTILVQHGKCKIFHPERGLIMVTTMSSNRMFTVTSLIQPKVGEVCLNSLTENQSSLWHNRYGHLSFTGLKALQQNNWVIGLPPFENPTKLCDACLNGKQRRDPFPKASTWRASQVLQLVHADICGPINPTSHSNKRYLLMFIDDYSRKTWVYFLAEKGEAFTSFKLFKNRVEKDTGSSLKCLRTDRGGEFTSREFTDFCQTHGISRQLTAAYTPQQNGVAERKNQTVMNMVRSMLSGKQMPHTFWPDAVNWAVYVLNRSPTFAVKGMTPEEAWSGIKPSVAHFRVFGCLAHVHIPDTKRKKLDDKSVQCVLLGVSEESKAYRLYDPATKKIIVSRDVIFDEAKGWNWTVQQEGASFVDLYWGEPLEDENTNADPVVVDSINTDADLAIAGGTNSDGSTTMNNASTEDVVTEDTPEVINRNTRSRREPAWMQDYIPGEELSEEDDSIFFAMFIGSDPISFQEAVKISKWRQAMDAEIAAIEKNDTWFLTDLPVNGKKIGVKWVYKTKLDANGEVDKYKARLVAKGYSQKHGVDYTEVFAPVARVDIVRLIISLAALKQWTIFQLDVKSAFLHGELIEDVFVEQPPGYIKKGAEQKVLKLKKALYGLKQAPRAWYSRIESYFMKEGFEKCKHEHTLFIKSRDGGKILIVCLYVDDLIFTGNDELMFAHFKKSMMLEFDMTDLGKMKYFLGIEVLQTADGIFIGQKKYVQEVLERFGMENCNSVKNPMVPGCKLVKDADGIRVDNTFFKQLVGSLMYLTATRPDIMFIVSLISRYMECPTELHLEAAKRLLRYLKGTADFGLFYKRGRQQELIAYTDSDYAGDMDDRKSTSGYVFMMGSGAVSWSSKKQPVVTLSTTEAEFISAASCACQAIWLRRILETLSHAQKTSTTVFCDNCSTIKLSKNPVMHGRSKHIDVRFHFLRELTRDGIVELIHCQSQEQAADIMTKPLKLDAFLKLRAMMGVCSISDIN